MNDTRAILLILFSITLSFVSPADAAAGNIKIVMLGDSLTEGYGISPEKAYPKLLQDKFSKSFSEQKETPKIQIINAGISGSTTASALSRLKWQLKGRPDILFLALGANDGLRGLDLKKSEENLSATIELAQEKKIHVILAGMQIPPNYGPKYTKEFAELFPRLAKKYDVTLIPFLLKDVAGIPELNLPDGIHPNEKGHEIIANHVYKYLVAAVKKN